MATSITSWTELQAMNSNLSEDYVLSNALTTSDGDYAAVAGPLANSGDGFIPIGAQGGGNEFTGSFDGQGFTITGLFINRPSVFVGLFGAVKTTSSKSIINVRLVNINITGYAGGGLCGINEGDVAYNIIDNCSVSGTVTASYGFADTGGLIGYGYMLDISNSFSSVTVTSLTIFSNYNIGGLCGTVVYGELTNCYATGNVTGGVQAGGLVGYSDVVTFDSCYATGNVLTNTTENPTAGGLVGFSYDCSFDNCYATGDVEGHGITTTTLDTSLGGFIGFNQSVSNNHIISCYATGNITGTSIGNVNKNFFDAGGFIGFHENDATNSIDKCFATGNITVVASGTGSIFSGQILAAGGFIGDCQNYGTETISRCYATGNIEAENQTINNPETFAGGFFGSLYYANVENCYATGNVCSLGILPSDSEIGGFSGYVEDCVGILNCYSRGSVYPITVNGGGFCGFEGGTSSVVTSCYWDMATSGWLTSVYGEGKTTEEMKTIGSSNVYVDWDFSTIWERLLV
jgi:hypothetical protein